MSHFASSSSGVHQCILPARERSGLWSIGSHIISFLIYFSDHKRLVNPDTHHTFAIKDSRNSLVFGTGRIRESIYVDVPNDSYGYARRLVKSREKDVFPISGIVKIFFFFHICFPWRLSENCTIPLSSPYPLDCSVFHLFPSPEDSRIRITSARA